MILFLFILCTSSFLYASEHQKLLEDALLITRKELQLASQLGVLHTRPKRRGHSDVLSHARSNFSRQEKHIYLAELVKLVLDNPKTYFRLAPDIAKSLESGAHMETKGLDADRFLEIVVSRNDFLMLETLCISQDDTSIGNRQWHMAPTVEMARVLEDEAVIQEIKDDTTLLRNKATVLDRVTKLGNLELILYYREKLGVRD